jgi:hypothetical protein
MPKKRANNRPKNRPRRRRATENNTIPRSLMSNSPFPVSRMVKLNTVLTFIMQSSSAYFARDFAINDLYQFDVSGLTNDFSGATQLAAIYESYHVQSLRVKYSVCSNETAVTQNFGLTFKDDQPGPQINSLAKAKDSLEVAPTTGSNIIGEITGMSVYRSPWYKISCGAIVGNPMSYNSDISYTGQFGASPTQKVWMTAVLYSPVNLSLTNGIIVTLTAELSVRVYSLKPLLQ